MAQKLPLYKTFDRITTPLNFASFRQIQSGFWSSLIGLVKQPRYNKKSDYR